MKTSNTRTQRTSAAQKRIADAALRLFAEKGTADIGVSELADAAGVARGTIYNNLKSPEHLFQQVASQLADEMNERVVASYVGVDSPAERIAMGIRLYVRRAHEEPYWGKFLLSFAYTHDSLRNLWTGAPMSDVIEGKRRGEFNVLPQQELSALGVVAGTTISAILGVIEGYMTWRNAGMDAAEFSLRALGVDIEKARAIASQELPPLSDI